MKNIHIARSLIEGKGVFASEPIDAHETILEIDDNRVVNELNPLVPALGEDEQHCDFLPDDTMVAMQAPEKFLNHCCEPNTYIRTYQGNRFLLAMRRLERGEELLFDYAMNAVGGGEWECRCGAECCRGVHRCDFFALPKELRRAYLPYLDPWFVQEYADRLAESLR
ncbi:MAG: SET domain-containing protein-lysine N-methyltransferase [Chitinivibrionales bacterium]|nr:SET domain-containing protein-lysine N-methyltransferase [Chitinivibrionales bacterium]